MGLDLISINATHRFRLEDVDQKPPAFMFLKLIACEIALREICYCASRSRNVIDLEFLTQGHHDHPCVGRAEIQKRIDSIPAGKYDAILIGYGLCSNILSGLTSPHTTLVAPRAHDCITLFLGSRTRYEQLFNDHPGTYYFTSGWLECPKRRGPQSSERTIFMPAHSTAALNDAHAAWVQKFGAEQADYLREALGNWTANYNRGVLIDYDFTQPLNLDSQVRKICEERNWHFDVAPGDLGLFQRFLDAEWSDEEFLIAKPGQKIGPSHNESIITATPLSA